MEGGEKKLKKKKLDCYRYILWLLPVVLIILAMVMPSAFAAASPQPQVISVKAVSYTHLDVYKRQVCNGNNLISFSSVSSHLLP